MTNTKATKRALLLSVMAMLVCVAMLVGTTFAWFTDSASTAVNKIQAGTLGIQLLAEDGVTSLEGQTLSWKKADGAGNEPVLWEPGCTYELQPIVIKNNGTLALKYKIVITGIKGDAELNNAIVWTITNNGQTYAVDQEVSLAANASATLTIKGHMKEDAGNEYKGKYIDNIAITVYATQDTVESDSTGNQYDKDAEYPVVSAGELKNALTQGGVVAINSNITADATKTETADRITISAPTTLNLDAKFIVPGELEPTSNWAGLYINADTVINASENGGIQCPDKANGEAGTYVANITGGANVTVNGGTYYGGGTTFQVQRGTLTINGGHFEVTSFGEPYNYNFLLNCIDANYANGTAKIIVTGGTFVNFNPADNVEIETKANGDIWYTVVPE